MQTIWQSQLLPASFRGAPFVVLDDAVRSGRRVAEHLYPFREVPYAEDLGRRAREYRFTGYVIGDDAIVQRNLLANACEQKGPGPLIHPTLGFLQVACAEFETEEHWDKGRVIAFRFAFLEAGQLLYPTTGSDTQAQTQFAADNVSASADQDLATNTGTSVGASGTGTSTATVTPASDSSATIQGQAGTVAEADATVVVPGPSATAAGAGQGTIDTLNAHAAVGSALDNSPAPSPSTAAAAGGPLVAPTSPSFVTPEGFVIPGL